MLRKCDAVIVSVHLDKKTKNLINKKFLDNLKNGTILINSSRGEILDDKELIKFLRKNSKSKVIIDVIKDEQKKIVEESDNLLLSDYDYEFIDNDDGCERFVVIENENNYTARELKAIYKTIYEDEDEIYDEEFMEENGWVLDDTTYEINGGVILN